MTSQAGDFNRDDWTGMPFSLEENDIDGALVIKPQVASPSSSTRQSASKRGSGWGLTEMFWKLMAAGSTSTPHAILICLATDESSRVRRRIAENDSTPVEILDFLADDIDETVRLAIAQNPRTPLHVVKKLSQDTSTDIRFAIASNPQMPDAILLSLFLDPNPFVAERASQTLAA